MNACEMMMMTINMSIRWSNRTMKLLKTPSFPLKRFSKKSKPVAEWSINIKYYYGTLALTFLRRHCFNPMFICDYVFLLKEVRIDERPNRCV